VGAVRLREALGQPKVEEVYGAEAAGLRGANAQHKVVGLDIAVEEGLGVRGLHAGHHLQPQGDGRLFW
jgi:hypothetical protein